MINGVNMAQTNSVNFQGRYSDMKDRMANMSKKEKIATAAAVTVGAAAITAGVIVRKDIKQLFKTGNFKQFAKNAGQTLKKAGKKFVDFLKHPIKTIKGWFKKKEPINVFSDVPGLSNETKKAMNAGRVEVANNIVREMEESMARTTPAAHAKRQKELDALAGQLVGSTKEHFQGVLAELESKIAETMLATDKGAAGRLAKLQAQAAAIRHRC